MRTTFLFALLLVFVLHVLVGAGRLRGYEMPLKEGAAGERHFASLEESNQRKMALSETESEKTVNNESADLHAAARWRWARPAHSAHHRAVAKRQSDDLSSQPEEAELFHIFLLGHEEDGQRDGRPQRATAVS